MQDRVECEALYGPTVSANGEENIHWHHWQSYRVVSDHYSRFVAIQVTELCLYPERRAALQLFELYVDEGGDCPM